MIYNANANDVSQILATADPYVADLVAAMDIDRLCHMSFAEGSERFVVDLGNGWVIKLPIEDDDEHAINQARIEYQAYSMLPDADIYSTRFLSTNYYLDRGIIFASKVGSFNDYCWEIDVDNGLNVDKIDYILEMYDESRFIFDDVPSTSIYDTFITSLSALLQWADEYDVHDVGVQNLGIDSFGEVVMLDLGYGSGTINN